MYYDFAYFLEEYLDSGVFLLTLISNSIGSLWGIGMYVLTSLGLYTIAKRRAINKAWLAWIPVVNCWLIGCISDQYRYVVKGQVKSKRKSLLALTIVQFGLVCAFVAALTVTIVCGVNTSLTIALIFIWIRVLSPLNFATLPRVSLKMYLTESISAPVSEEKSNIIEPTPSSKVKS